MYLLPIRKETTALYTVAKGNQLNRETGTKGNMYLSFGYYNYFFITMVVVVNGNVQGVTGTGII